MSNRTGLFWFTNDLRLHDNHALQAAVSEVDELLCVYVDDSRLLRPNRYGVTARGATPRQFQIQSLNHLKGQLEECGNTLLILQDEPVAALTSLIRDAAVTHVFRSRNAGWYERQDWSDLQDSTPRVVFSELDTHTLFDKTQLPFGDNDLPISFTKFRKLCEDITVESVRAKPVTLPPAPKQTTPQSARLESDAAINQFQGGEKAGENHLDHYFSGQLPANYKNVRNAIDGWDNSCKLSPWLANGCISAREVMRRLAEYEASKVANESTYWIYFELLWREYFQWYAHQYGNRLFRFSGIKSKAPLTSFYPERFKKWCTGTTPYPLVNACMNELTKTGYLSNRGRQIAASCFVNELQLDWRYGAAYFEQCLIDYDVASNWGNWQYLAGVGADPRDQRHFNLDKQTQQFDPKQRYIKKWNGDAGQDTLDSVDAADWPI